MAIQKQTLKSCCGRTSTLMTVSKPVLLEHVPLFEAAGFLLPQNYVKQGIFYCRKDGFVAVCTFGISKITIRCTGSNCLHVEMEFEQVLNKIQQ